MKRLHSMLLITLLGAASAQAQVPCPFAADGYLGTTSEQATCLLRFVKPYGNIGQQSPLPPTISQLMSSKNLDFTLANIKRYLLAKNISEDDVGGPIDRALNARTRYFIIHDTSTPNLLDKPFPANINEVSWGGNRLAAYTPKAHVYISRVGSSVMKVNFADHQHTTKFELQDHKRDSMFVGVELVQPRRMDPAGGNGNDALSPTPGFSAAQLERLALVYLVASARAGQYLVPTFHSVVDTGIKGAHDDPQNFDLKAWDDALAKAIGEIRKVAVD